MAFLPEILIPACDSSSLAFQDLMQVLCSLKEHNYIEKEEDREAAWGHNAEGGIIFCIVLKYKKH